MVVAVMGAGQVRAASREGGLTVRTLDALAVGERVLMVVDFRRILASAALRAYPV